MDPDAVDVDELIEFWTSDRAIAHQTRHRSPATLGTSVRVQQAWTDNAATILGL